MALQLQKEVKGVQANYWKIVKSCFDVYSNQTTVTLALYVSQEARLAGINNDLTSTSFSFEGFKTIAQSYDLIKQSKKAQREVTPAIYKTETLISDGINAPYSAGTEYESIVQPLEIITPAVMEEYETNMFANAIDC